MATCDISASPGSLRDFVILDNQVALLYTQSTITFIFPIFAAVALCWTLWDVAARGPLLIWTGIALSYCAARYLLLWCYRRRQASQDDPARWLDYFTRSVFISGLIWGAAPIMLMPFSPDRLMDFIVYNGLILIVICGLAAGALAAYSVSKWVLFFYLFPALVPPAFYLISLGDRYNSTMGGFVLLYFVFIALSSLRLNAQHMHYIGLQAENEALNRKCSELEDRLGEMTTRRA